MTWLNLQHGILGRTDIRFEILGGVTMMGTGGEEQPRVIVLDKDSRVVKATGPNGEFVTTTQTVKLPELKAQVDQLSDPENEVNSIAFMKGQLDRDPKSFRGNGRMAAFPGGSGVPCCGCVPGTGSVSPCIW
jgi:hypothetical protein